MPKFIESCRAIKNREGHASFKLNWAESTIPERDVVHPFLFCNKKLKSQRFTLPTSERQPGHGTLQNSSSVCSHGHWF